MTRPLHLRAVSLMLAGWIILTAIFREPVQAIILIIVMIRFWPRTKR